MAQASFDWTPIRGALGLAVICLLISAGVVVSSGYFRDQMESEYRTYQTQFRDVTRKYLSVDDQERIIEEQLPEFVQLYRSGIIGDERRLDWVEALRAIDADLALPELDWKLESRAVREPSFALDLGVYDLLGSRMTLNAGLLHEGDLLELFALLDAAGMGLHTVDSCAMKREAGPLPDDARRKTISLDCELSWFTIRPRGRDLAL